MAKSQCIKPFPIDIDRNRFGDYLSGFSDGEACFNLYTTSHQTPGAAFTIALRQDDDGILHLIQSYWNCGRLYHTIRRDRGKVFPIIQYSIYVVADLERVVVPHFEQFPLFAKKSKDFLIWKEGVLLICRRRRHEQGITGRFAKCWDDEEKAEFTAISESLKAQREFNPSNVQPIYPDQELPLFE